MFFFALAISGMKEINQLAVGINHAIDGARRFRAASLPSNRGWLNLIKLLPAFSWRRAGQQLIGVVAVCNYFIFSVEGNFLTGPLGYYPQAKYLA